MAFKSNVAFVGGSLRRKRRQICERVDTLSRWVVHFCCTSEQEKERLREKRRVQTESQTH